MTTNELFAKLHEAAANPQAQMDKYLAQGKKIVLCAPVRISVSFGCIS